MQSWRVLGNRMFGALWGQSKDDLTLVLVV